MTSSKTTHPNALRTGFTTGACATAAASAACGALLGGGWDDPVRVRLPRGGKASFALAGRDQGEGWTSASIQKDAGDDPDITHGALICARVEYGAPGTGVTFRAGVGVGIVTRPGLPLEVGQPAINPVPRQMITETLQEIAAHYAQAADFTVTISVPNGAVLAQNTWNPRLGIIGGLSILGTTGIVRPYSCAAWIASIHRGVDVARAAVQTHLVGATGATSEAAARAYFALPDIAMLDMGDFAGGLLKYIRRHPVERLTIAGGVGKLAKLAQGALDLHSARSQTDFARLAADSTAPDKVRRSNTVLEAITHDPALIPHIGQTAANAAAQILGSGTKFGVLLVDRQGRVQGHFTGAPTTDA
jgi:cobalt-precorrin-5B (C1)-methyltransferase